MVAFMLFLCAVVFAVLAWALHDAFARIERLERRDAWLSGQVEALEREADGRRVTVAPAPRPSLYEVVGGERYLTGQTLVAPAPHGAGALTPAGRLEREVS